jgi:enediyne biosynthesis protein E7
MASRTATRAPGPRGHTLTGCLGEFRADPIGLLLRVAERYGDVVRLRIGPVLAHLVNHPDHIEHVFVRNARNYDKNTRSVSRLRATCGQSLLTTDGERWSRHRKLIQPAFQPAVVERIAPVARTAISHMLERWSEAATAGRSIDVVSEMMHVTLRIAAQSLFGADVERDVNVVEDSLAAILDDTWRRLESWVDFSRISSAFESRRFRAAVDAIDRIVYRIIEAARRHPGAAPGCLSMLLGSRDAESGGAFSDEEARDATITLLLAGHETTANALAWTIYLVAQSSDVQTRLHLELDRVLGQRSPARSDFERLPYTNQVWSEALRLYPSIWIMERRVKQDDEIGGFEIPAGSTLLVSPLVLHRHPHFWPDAEIFSPERFSAAAAWPKRVYIPFGIGAHQCIGRHMAHFVAQFVLAMTFHRFRVQLMPGPQNAPQPGITLRHRMPWRINVREYGK